MCGQINRQLKIAFVTTSFPLTRDSASGTFILKLAKSLPASMSVEVITPCASVQIQQQVSEEIAIRCVRYAPKRWQTLAHGPGGIPAAMRRGWRAWIQLGFLLPAMFIACLRAARKADLIHANWSVTGVIAGIAGRLTGTPVITTLRGSDVNKSEENRLFLFLLKACYRLSDLLVTVGEGIQKRIVTLIGIDAQKVRVIPNGVDEAFFSCQLPQLQGVLRIITVGSLVPIKGMDTLLNALALLPKDMHWELTVVGDGPERIFLESMVKNLKIDKYIYFKGALPPHQVPEQLALNHVFVLASRSEGRPNALLEALAASKAVVASSIPAITELIDDGGNGLLFPPDDPRFLAAQLQRLYQDAALLQRLAEKGRASVTGFNWSSTGCGYANIYQEILESEGFTHLA